MWLEQHARLGFLATGADFRMRPSIRPAGLGAVCLYWSFRGCGCGGDRITACRNRASTDGGDGVIDQRRRCCRGRHAHTVYRLDDLDIEARREATHTRGKRGSAGRPDRRRD